MSIVVTGMAFFMVMVTVRSGIFQFSPKKRFHRFIGAAFCTGAKLDAVFLQSSLCAAADAAADQNVDLSLPEKSGKRFMTAAVRTDQLGRNNPAVLYLINLERLRMSEVLKHIAVFIRHSNSHSILSLFPILRPL